MEICCRFEASDKTPHHCEGAKNRELQSNRELATFAVILICTQSTLIGTTPLVILCFNYYQLSFLFFSE